VNTQQLRQSVKTKWLDYYQANRPWLDRLAIWINHKGQRRPSSSFILATLSVLEPQLPFMFPIMVELSNDPDRIVAALGLNFNPAKELEALAKAEKIAEQAALAPTEVKLLPSPATEFNPPTKRISIRADEDCQGGYRSPR
jgi:Family of unknown function (DUF5331)